MHGNIKKKRTLNTSLENLAIQCEENDANTSSMLKDQPRGKKRIAATTTNENQLEKKIKIEPHTQK